MAKRGHTAAASSLTTVVAAQRVALDKADRVRIPTEVIEALSWLPLSKKGDGSIPCIAVRGPEGGIQIDRADGELSQRRIELLAKLRERKPSALESGLKAVALARLYGDAWEISLQADSSHHRFVVPAELLDSGILGKDPKEVVVFAAGEILEIWGCAEWDAHLGRTASDAAELHRAAARELRQ